MECEKKIITPPTVNKSANGYYIYREYKRPDREGRTFDEYMDASGKWYESMAVNGRNGVGGTYFFDKESAELALKKAEEKNMKKLDGKIEHGKYYKNRRGGKIGPMYVGYTRAWVEGEEAQDREWNFDGTHSRYIRLMTHEDDLIEEWEVQPKPWGEMTPEEKGALLLAAYEGKELEFYHSNGKWHKKGFSNGFNDNTQYRVSPTRTVEVIGPDGYRITYKEIDGVPDCSTIRIEKV